MNNETKKKRKDGKKVSSVKKSDKATKKSTKSKPMNIKFLGGLLFSKMAKNGAVRLGNKADEVNKLNVFPVPDGDTGDNMRMTIESGIAAIENMDSDNLADVMKALSHGMLLGARGNSGVILSQFFAGTAKGLEKTKKADPETFGNALRMGVKQAYSSVMTPTEGTILTVARESVEYAVGRINEKSTIRSLFADLVKEMHASLERTPELLTVLKEAGVVDSGATGLLYIMDGFNSVLNGEVYDVASDNAVPMNREAARATYSFNENSKMEYGYCTELLVQLLNSKTDIANFDVDALKEFLVSVGDSVVAFKTESIVKLHVHTFTPEKVLAYCRQFGEFLTVKIENMSVQHTENSENSENEEEAPKKENNGKTGFGAHATTAMFVGLCAAYIGSYLGKAIPREGYDIMPLFVAVGAALVMAVFEYFIQKKGKAALENFSLAASMLLAMTAAVFINMALSGGSVRYEYKRKRIILSGF